MTRFSSHSSAVCTVSFVFFFLLCPKQSVSTGINVVPLPEQPLLHTRSLEATKPSVGFRFLVENLPLEIFKDAMQEDFLQALAEVAGVDRSQITLQSVQPSPPPPPVVVECDNTRYLCGKSHRLQRDAYLSAVQGDCIEFQKAGLVLCGRLTLKTELYQLVRNGDCKWYASSDKSAPEAQDALRRRLLSNANPDSFVVVAKISANSNAEALAVRTYVATVFHTKGNDVLSAHLERHGFFGITVGLLGEPDFKPGVLTYYWKTGGWERCSVLCGGGVQSRAITCHSNQGEQVGSWLCNHDERPETRNICNEHSCELQVLHFTEVNSQPGMCTKECGGGVKYASTHCVGKDGYVGQSGFCGVSKGKPVGTACHNTPCDGSASWESVSWGKCSKKCGGGKMRINRECMKNENIVGDDLCEGNATLSKSCNTAPCEAVFWDVQPWGECDKPCGGGKMRRTVECKDHLGNEVAEELCPPKPKTEAQCNIQRCDFCWKNNCSKRGYCKNGMCHCYQGFRGNLCELPDSCNGVLDKNKHCCNSGILDNEGNCCSDGSLVSAQGECCRELDAAGSCSGTAKFLSLDDQVCKHLLDAEGFCCHSGVLDDCGICDGDSSTCSATVEALLQVLDAGALYNTTTFHGGVASFIQDVLAIDESSIKVVKTEITNDLTPSIIVRATFTIAPETTSAGDAVISSQFIWSKLTAAIGSVLPNNGFFNGVEKVSREAVCGNKVCEIGERAIYKKEIDGSEALVAGCPEDCKLQYKECPVGKISGRHTPDFCSAHGQCRSASGECDCWKGYTGRDCSLCEEGYVRSGRLCVPQFTVEGVKFAPTDGASTVGQPVTVLILCVSALALVALIAGAVLLKRSRTDILSRLEYPAEGGYMTKKQVMETLGAAKGLSFHAPRALSSPLLSGLGGLSCGSRSLKSGATLHMAPSKRGTTCASEYPGISEGFKKGIKSTVKIQYQELDSLLQDKDVESKDTETGDTEAEGESLTIVQCPAQAMPTDLEEEETSNATAGGQQASEIHISIDKSSNSRST